MLTACYLINRTPSFVLHYKTPYEMLLGKLCDYEFLRVFGCLCYAHNQWSKGNKFESRSTKCVFLGYPFRQKDGNCMTWKHGNILCHAMSNSMSMFFRL